MRFHLKNMFKNLLLEYCNESSIHGVRYLIDKRKTKLERVFWIIFFSFSIICCLWFTLNLYKSAQQNSIIMTISNRPMVITDISFPSVTICPTVPFNASEFNITRILDDDFEYANDFNQDELLALLAHYCNMPDDRQEVNNSFNFVKTLLKVNLRLNYLRLCRLGINRQACYDDFQEVITNMGVCFTYNSLSSKELFRSHNGTAYDFSSNLKQNKNTLNNLKNFIGPNERGRMELSFKINPKIIAGTCKPSANGFQVALRSSPKDATFFLNSADVVIKEDYATDFSLTPKVLVTHENLKAFHIEERECYFEGERELFFLRYYTQDNCHYECLTNLTLNKCGCVHFFMPRLRTTPICLGKHLIKCAAEIEQSYDNMGSGPCHCYSLCNHLNFQFNVATYKLNLDNFLIEEKGKIVETRIGIFTIEKSVYPLKRSQLYGFNDYVASFGGLLGLFLGVSILSVIELFYYAILRPICLLLVSQKKDLKEIKMVKSENVSLKNGKSLNWVLPVYDLRKEIPGANLLKPKI